MTGLNMLLLEASAALPRLQMHCVCDRLKAAPGFTYSSMTLGPSSSYLAAAGLNLKGEAPCIDIFSPSPGSLAQRAHLRRQPASLISSIASLPGSSLFATGPPSRTSLAGSQGGFGLRA
jgi:hypothetical protein